MATRQVSYLNGQQIKEINGKLAKLRVALVEIPRSPYATVRDSGTKQVRKEIRQLEETLNRKTPPKFNEVERNKLNSRRKTLEGLIKKNMPNASQMYGKRVVVPNGGAYFETDEHDVRQQVAWMKEVRGYQKEYRNICKILDVENVNFGSLEALRSKL